MTAPVEEADDLDGMLCCKVGCQPMNYLGMPSGSSFNLESHTKENEVKTIGWKKLYLSNGGRLTLSISSLW